MSELVQIENAVMAYVTSSGPNQPTVLSTFFRKLFFAWRFTQKKKIGKLLSCFNAKPFVITINV